MSFHDSDDRSGQVVSRFARHCTDSVSMVSHVDTNALSNLQGRVSFIEHSFFNQQSIVGAATYLLRLVAHKWDDQSCVRIFKAIVPALEKSPPKTPLLINDIFLPDLGMESSRFEEHCLRQVDMMMMTVLGSKQRTITEFAELLWQSNKRLKIHRVRKGRNGGLLEVFLIK
ncbi:hypothetical protein DE146DRAFT_658009 [Phaeosphaeria sp. MPI-PUGE-AT-0046c]|nr:hypothetical protein DE146DRAFT_658009 [Phaeosphaeria sp. MPI-PUGE-AT-0046c]